MLDELRAILAQNTEGVYIQAGVKGLLVAAAVSFSNPHIKTTPL